MSCIFVDGPAAGVVLTLSRSPVYLRVVRDEHGRWDALDQLDDLPRAGEAIFVYRLVPYGSAPKVHVNYGDRRSGWRAFGTYEVVDVLGEQFRSQAAWEWWASRQPVPVGIDAYIPEGGEWPPLAEHEEGWMCPDCGAKDAREGLR